MTTLCLCELTEADLRVLAGSARLGGQGSQDARVEPGLLRPCEPAFDRRPGAAAFVALPLDGGHGAMS